MIAPSPSHHLLFLLSPPCQVEVQSDPAKLINDNSSSDAEDIHWKLIKELNLAHLKAHVQFIWCDHFWFNETEYVGDDFLRIIASSRPLFVRKKNYHPRLLFEETWYCFTTKRACWALSWRRPLLWHCLFYCIFRSASIGQHSKCDFDKLRKGTENTERRGNGQGSHALRKHQ